MTTPAAPTTRKRLTLTELASVAIKMAAEKEQIQAAVNSGAAIKKLADDYGVHVASFRKCFKAVGLTKRPPKEKKPPRQRVSGAAPAVLPASVRLHMDGAVACALVVARIARHVGVPCTEVTDFLNKRQQATTAVV